MAPLDTTSYWSIGVSIALSCTTFELFDAEQYRDLEFSRSLKESRSLKLVPFKSLDTVSYSHSIVTMNLSYIISEIKRDIGS